MRLVNLTSKTAWFTDGRQYAAVEPSTGPRPWVDLRRVNRQAQVEVDGLVVPVYDRVVDRLIGLPDPEPDVLLYVPGIIARIVADHRHDVVGAGQLVKQGDGSFACPALEGRTILGVGA